MIGGSGRQRTLNMVARFADEWNCVNGDLASYPELNSVLEGHCKDAGRDPSTIKRSIMGGFIVGRNENEMLDRAKKLKEISPGNAELEPKEIIERARNRWGFAGTPEELIENIKKLEGLGVSRFMLQMLDQDDLDAVDLISQEVNPHV